MGVASRNTLEAVNNCSKFDSRLLASAIKTKLPRELRDMIHYFCWEEKLRQYDYYQNERPWRASKVDDEKLSGDGRSGAGHPMPQVRASALRPYLAHHFVNPAFVGEDAAREATEAFYRMAPAYVETFDTPRLEDYFNHDNFSLGVVPREFITAITFFLDECARVHSSHQEFAWGWGQSNRKTPPFRLTEEGLSAIFDSECKRLPRVTLLTRSEKPTVAVEILHTSLFLYKQLQDRGANVTVVYRYGTKLDGERIRPIDLGAIMELPRCDWEHHFMQECDRQDPQNSWVRNHIEKDMGRREDMSVFARSIIDTTLRDGP
ncbi:hypothetical protein CC86DRAFT_145450 [Ophiobolus disseminans]|uniref:Uncharacterized protein n=1 Tax=Ophiobolus disseminans TaxID=1469910 RepID=A0A6A6ZGT0_9PLEO|nr:hypothetical protein CC86DRAFT_145450 [Ophiobolus disseminans]